LSGRVIAFTFFQFMTVKIDDLLRGVTACGASDLHIKAGSFPVMRVDGELNPSPMRRD
jgi:Tfp pilus assembly pilus retraction ATPase PilT